MVRMNKRLLTGYSDAALNVREWVQTAASGLDEQASAIGQQAFATECQQVGLYSLN